MIILEGPDGGGKTTLLKRLSEETLLSAHERASDSVKGPLADLYGWTVNDMESWSSQKLSIYDRHPLTSEHIYGPSVRGAIRPGFEMTNPKLGHMRRYLREHALVIVCLPPLEVVKQNVANEIEQMPGVVENIEHIYDCYRMMLHIWPLDSHICRYDYTANENKEHGYQGIYAAVMDHQYSWRGVR